MSAGEIVGIVFGTLAFAALVVLAVILGLRVYQDRKGTLHLILSFTQELTYADSKVVNISTTKKNV